MLCCSIAGILIANLLAMFKLRRAGACASEPGGTAVHNWTVAGALAATLMFGALGAIAVASAAPFGHICSFVAR